MDNMNLNLLKIGLSLKTGLSLYLVLTLTRKKISNIFFQKIKSSTMPVQHVKGQPAAATYVREKGRLTFYTHRETPCSS